MKRLMMICAMLLVFMFAMTSVSSAAGTWWGTKCTVVAVSSSDTTPTLGYTFDGAPAGKIYWILFKDAITNAKEMMAVILTAQSSGKKITLQVEAGKLVGVAVYNE